MNHLVPVVLCGGAGSRLWPLSRESFPKQLLSLVSSNTSMLEDTLLRCQQSLKTGESVVICNEAHRFLVAAQIAQHESMSARIVLEPEGRNTAPAVAVAANLALQSDPEALLMVVPADHVIRNTESLSSAIGLAAIAAAEGRLVTFGVVPEGPETGYGYIRADISGPDAVPVEAFVEKPDSATAQQYLADGNYLWNSGMFMLPAKAYLEELERFVPAMADAARRAVETARQDSDYLWLGRDAFLESPDDSIDYAVMERTDRASVVPLDAGWSDVGSWSALHDVSDSDDEGNTLLGDVLVADCTNTYVRADERMVAAVGLDNCIVVQTKDATLVAPRDRAQDVKTIVNNLKDAGREEFRFGREVFRPWGSYDSLENADGFQVKRLKVLPGAVLSLQLHHRRAEHWVVVRGTARITLGEKEFDLEPNESTYIPVETIHRVANPGQEMLEIIEVQVGDYLGEDDIERFEDQYGRAGTVD